MKFSKRILSAIAVIIAAGGIVVWSKNSSPVPPTPIPPITVPSPLPPPPAPPIISSGGSERVGPDVLYPDPNLTPGKADTLSLSDLTATYSDNCPHGKTSCTYSQDHRNVPAAEHTQVYDEYNVSAANRNIQSGEVDHFYPLCAGGSNDISNLWFQPIQNEWNGKDFGFKTKDKLESWVCVQIKAGKLDPQSAYDQITTDWVKFYLDNESAISSQPSFGGVME